MARFLEQEVLQDLQVDETDLRNHFEANRERYQQALQGEQKKEEITFETARPVVESEYRMIKLQSAYQELIDSELSAQEVTMFPERMNEAS